MSSVFPALLGWTLAVLVAVLPPLAVMAPHLAPAALATVLAGAAAARRTGDAGPGPLALPVVSAVATLAVTAGWVVAGGWLALALVVGAVSWSWLSWRPGHPDAGALVALVGWAGAFVARPQLLTREGGGFVAPAVLLVGTLVLGRRLRLQHRAPEATVRTPTREVRGTLSVRGVVLAGGDGLVRSVPLDLDLRAGESLAVLCDAPAEGEALALTVAGRRQPLQGEVAVDGVPVGRTDVLVAVIAEGEELLPGSLADNLGALCGEPVSRDTLNAIWEACSLDDVATALGDRGLARDGSPLEPFHRLLLLAARVIPSRFRIVVVIDPMPWVNAVRRELWRGSLTRAAVGRTAVWVTADRDLASCADRVLELKNGGLRTVDG